MGIFRNVMLLFGAPVNNTL